MKEEYQIHYNQNLIKSTVLTKLISHPCGMGWLWLKTPIFSTNPISWEATNRLFIHTIKKPKSNQDIYIYIYIYFVPKKKLIKKRTKFK